MIKLAKEDTTLSVYGAGAVHIPAGTMISLCFPSMHLNRASLVSPLAGPHRA